MLKVSLFLRKKTWCGENCFPGRTASLLGYETAVLLVGCGSFIFKTRRRVFLNTCLLNHIWLWNVWFCFILWWWESVSNAFFREGSRVFILVYVMLMYCYLLNFGRKKDRKLTNPQ